VSSIEQAAVLLGFETLGKFVVMAGASSLLGTTLKGYRLDSEVLWKHSLAVAFGSRIIANKKNPESANDAFLAGLIHDIGKIVLDKYVLKMREAFDEFMGDGGQTFLSAEKNILGFDHSEMAYEACTSWHFPDTITAAIRHHHDSFNTQGNGLAHIVHMADSIAMMSIFGSGADAPLYKVDDRVRESLGLRQEEVNAIVVEVVESVEKVTEGMQ
jgi:HD-like signal output (HDOD) protein